MTITRRELLTKGAVAGAIVWSVPMIESVTARAAAQSGSTGAFNCSWAILVWYVPGGANVDSGTFYVNGWMGEGSNGGCSQGNNNKYNDVVTTWLDGADGSTKITVDFTDAKQVTITDPSNGYFITIPLPGGTGSLVSGGGTPGDCTSTGLTQSGQQFTVSGTAEFIAAIAFGPDPVNESPGSSTQTINYPSSCSSS
jgi:hypothetical protein